MRWVRLDAAIPRNHKVLALMSRPQGPRAFTLYVCGLAHAGEQETDGFVPEMALKFLHGRAQDAQALVDVGLWQRDEGGWLINDWADFQMSTEEMRQRSKRARQAAAARWGLDRSDA